MCGVITGFLLTRPAQYAERSTASLHSCFPDIPVLHAPMQRLKPLEITRPFAQFDACCITSQASLSALRAMSDYTWKTTFCVGTQTADMARDLKLPNVVDCEGDWQAMRQNIKAVPPPAARILRLRGSHFSDDSLYDALRQDGYQVECLETYTSQPVDHIPVSVVAALKEGGISHILFYAPSAARQFMSLVVQQKINVAHCTAVCLSPAIAQHLLPDTFLTVQVSPDPNESAMIHDL